MRAVPGSDPTQIKNLQRLGIPERSSADLPSQNSTVTAIQSPSVASTAACGSSTRTKVSVNLVPGLAYFDLVEDELSASMNDDGMIFPMGDTPIPNPQWPPVLTVQSHGGMGSGGGAGWKPISGWHPRDPLVFRQRWSKTTPIGTLR